MLEPKIKRRRLKVDPSFPLHDSEKTKEFLKAMKGLFHVSILLRKRIIKIQYDLTKVNLDAIEKVIQSKGYALSQKLIPWLKRGMINFMEQNEMDHLNAKPPPCCSDHDV